VTDCAAAADRRRKAAQDFCGHAENQVSAAPGEAAAGPAGDASALGVAMTATSTDGQFEKTFRLVCRLDDADIDYVRNTAEWIRRCVARVLAVSPEATANDITPIVVDMSTRGRWRLMRPETVAEQLAISLPRPGGE
jgi:hypothetical protein